MGAILMEFLFLFKGSLPRRRFHSPVISFRSAITLGCLNRIEGFCTAKSLSQELVSEEQAKKIARVCPFLKLLPRKSNSGVMGDDQKHSHVSFTFSRRKTKPWLDEHQPRFIPRNETYSGTNIPTVEP